MTHLNPHNTLGKADMDEKGPPPPPKMVVEAVLGDDNLLYEILIRLAFPTTLVRATCVGKRWLRLASAPAILCRFRGFHPPRLLGFYVHTMSSQPSCFMPLPQPPELATGVRRSSFDLDTSGCDRVYMDFCYSGFFIISSIVSHHDNGLPPTCIRRGCSPLYPARYTDILPPAPNFTVDEEYVYYGIHTIPSVGSGVLSCFLLAIAYGEEQSIVDVYVLQDGHWVIYTSVVSDIPELELELDCFLADAKIYNLARVNNILKLVLIDLVSSCLSVVDLPEEVNLLFSSLMLEDDSGVHLTHVKGSQVRVWLHRMDNNGVGNWFLVNTACLREIWANHMIPTCMFNHLPELCAVGANSEFVFLKMDGALYLFDIKRKDVKKVYELVLLDEPFLIVTPVIMVWPPKFPVMKEGCDQKD